MKKRTVVIVILLSLLIIAGIIGAIYFLRKRSLGGYDKNIVYVESVRSINGLPVGNTSRFMGIVESQESKGVNKDSGKSVKEVYVKVGDTVKKGDKLFAYDTTEMELSLEQLNIERTGIVNNIDSLNTSLSDYTTQRNKATDQDDILSYTSQINSTNSSIKEAEYDLSVKDLEIKKMKESIEKAVVTSPMNGIVKTAGTADAKESDDDSDFDADMDMDDDMDDMDDMSYSSEESEESDAFITIIAEGDYRIKGITDEMNIHNFTSGTKIILRSRTDESVTWKGKIAKVDMEPKSEQNDYYDYGESASNYNFYVTPESTDNMILGQHLFIELDYGQEEGVKGVQLPAYYIVKEEAGTFVWKKGEDGNIVKAAITLGEHNEEADTYEITAGLTLDDYVAYPDDGIKEGDPTTTNYDDISGSEDFEDEDFEMDETDGFGDEGMGGEESEDGTLTNELIEDSDTDFPNIDDSVNVNPSDDNTIITDPGELIDSPEDLSDDEDDSEDDDDEEDDDSEEE